MPATRATRFHPPIYLGGAAPIGGVIAAVAVVYRFTALNRVLLFWIAFELTRPIDTTFGDLPTKPVSHGGVNLGTAGSSLVLAALLVALVAWITISNRRRTII